ncbi:MAG: holo-[acyl-carrier-protein] synthase [Deltaproteobacteria bacterium]|nr:MAG: holo-[acyl-carrier-protein] synthase [Deltaproteobacteria bacterium]
MVKGIGIDIVDIGKVKRACQKWQHLFLHKVFSEREIKYCFSKKNPYPHLAARFACKEAVIKALGKNIGFKKIEVENLDTGKPLCKINDEEYKNCNIMVSLSHLEKYATSVAILIEKG